ncbi:MAG: hypothetical protein KAR43_04050, partial [Deltaproteobacteria bacterium]|nr:hypothetical protein [Deltaproteobacteria bacterium]
YILAKEGDVIINVNTCGDDICEAFDDDMDGFFDEDPYDQIDNDGDGRIDEDPMDFPNEITDVVGKPVKTLGMVENDLFFSKSDKYKKKLLESKIKGFPN